MLLFFAYYLASQLGMSGKKVSKNVKLMQKVSRVALQSDDDDYVDYAAVTTEFVPFLCFIMSKIATARIQINVLVHAWKVR